MLPNCSSMQFYQPAAHVVRRGWSTTLICAWLLCGHRDSKARPFSAIKHLGDCWTKFDWPTRAYVNSMIEGAPLRIEAVVSGRSASEVFSLVPSYGARIVDFCMHLNCVVVSNKKWPEFVNSLMLRLDELRARVSSYINGEQRNLEVR